MTSRLVVLVSGEGTNLQALIDACGDEDFGARVVAVGADRGPINALARATVGTLPSEATSLRSFSASGCCVHAAWKAGA